jgi:hypothetical protein
MENDKHVLLNTGNQDPILVYSFMMIFIIFMIGILHSSQKGVRFSKHMNL